MAEKKKENITIHIKNMTHGTKPKNKGKKK